VFFTVSEEKILVVENIRRAWLTNIVNTYVLVMLLPFYVVAKSYGLVGTMLYATLLVLLGPFVVFRLALRFTRRMLRDLAGISNFEGSIQVVFMVLYGDCAVRWTTIYVPILIFVSLTIDLLLISLLAKIFLVFLIFFVLIFVFTYKNMRRVVVNLDNLLMLVEKNES